MQTYKYDAFISYRHTEPDKAIAEKLHRMLETFKVPKAVIKMGSQIKVGRVFRDREELPTSPDLAENIQQALESSEHLIVICSPRTPSSQWVCKEIETFASLHGHERILALLIEGEPEDSFPEQLRFVKSKVFHEDETVTGLSHPFPRDTRSRDTEIREVEPLAADIRAQNLTGMKKRLKTEILRLLAPILNCRFDDLKQRHRERMVKRALTLSIAVSLFFFCFGSYSAYQAALIKQQSELIQQKSEQVEQKSKEVERHAEMLESQVQKTLRGQSLYLSDIAENHLMRGDRLGAVLVAREALPENPANPERPYVEEAEYALCNALGVYETAYDILFGPDLILKHGEKVTHTVLSPGGKTVVTTTYSGMIHIWNAENGMLLNTYVSDIQFPFIDHPYLLDDDTLLFLNNTGVHCLDVVTLEEKWFYACSGSDLAVSSDHSKAALVYGNLLVLDTSTGEPLMDAPLESILPDRKMGTYGSNAVFDESGGYVFFAIDDGNVVKIDLDRMELAGVYQAAYEYVSDIIAAPDGRSAVISHHFDMDMDGIAGLDVFDSSGNVLYSTTSDDVMENPIFNPMDSDQLLYVSYDELVILNTSDGTRHVYAHGERVSGYYILDELIISSSYDGNIRFWNTEGSEYSMNRIVLNSHISMLDFTPGLFAITDAQEVVLLRPFENRNALPLTGHSEFIMETVCLEDGRHLLSCSDNGELILWDLENAKAIATIHTHASIKAIYSVDHGSKIMTLSDDRRFTVYDSATLDLIHSVIFDDLYRPVLSPDHSLCYLLGWNGVQIIDTSNLETVMTLPIANTMEAVFFNDNSRMILGTTVGLSILDIPGQTVTKEKEAGEVKSLRLSHDNSILACIWGDQSVKLFDANNLEEILTINCPGPGPKAAFFDPLDKTLFISLMDDSIGRYDLADGTLIGVLDRKVKDMDDILFCKDMNLYITKGMLESYIWNNDTNKPIGRIHGLCTADLESGQLFVKILAKLYALTLFDTQMLLDEAEQQLQGRTLTPEEKKALFIVE